MLDSQDLRAAGRSASSERIVQGKVEKWLDDVAVLRQARRQRETGENVVIRCFSRFAVGG